MKSEVRLRLESLEDRCLLSSADFRTLDGSNNNLANPTWGKVNTNFIRQSPADYTDSSSLPAGADRPSARTISNAIGAQGSQDLPNNRKLSTYITMFGQFLDHDTDLITVATYINGTPCCPFPIPVPAGDPYFDPQGTGNKTIAFFRSKWDPYTGYSQSNPRQQPNEIAGWIDGSVIYGSDPVRAAALRTFQGGRLKTSEGNLLPFNTNELPNQNDGQLPDTSMFLAGDIRANATIQLTAMHTLFVREHNWWADQISQTHQLLDDETIYQLARQIVGAELQVITYKEFLPALLGKNAIPAYTGYKENVNGTISQEFATAAFRFGHSTINDLVLRLNNDGSVISQGNIELKYTAFNPTLLDPNLPNGEGDIDPLLKGASSQLAQEIDTFLVDAVRNLLFGPPGSSGTDLNALDIQRGRDHGLTDYNTMREYFGLPRVSSFAEITANVSVQQALQALYGTVDNIDAMAGGLAEDHKAGSSVGPLFHNILVDQFTRLRDGDRYWYTRHFSGVQLFYLEQTSLAKIIKRNTELTNIQPNVFFARRGGAGTPIPAAPPQSARVASMSTEVPAVPPSVVTLAVQPNVAPPAETPLAAADSPQKADVPTPRRTIKRLQSVHIDAIGAQSDLVRFDVSAT
jgi:hypothetical protein